MKILVCGGREFRDRKLMAWVLDPYQPELAGDLLIIQGGARGADEMAKQWAFAHGAAVMEFPANWKFHRESAGPIRNLYMLRWSQPDLVISFPGGNGTADMVARAKKAGTPVIEINAEAMRVNMEANA